LNKRIKNGAALKTPESFHVLQELPNDILTPFRPNANGCPTSSLPQREQFMAFTGHTTSLVRGSI
jgi:hypothetical protein